MENRYDVAIIGGGVIGLCSAYSLVQSGARVAVLDKGTFEDGASFVNAGLLVPSHIETLAAPGVITQGIKWLADPESPFYIKPRIDMDLTRWLWGFQAACTSEHVARSIPLLLDLALDSLERYRTMAKIAGLEDARPIESGLLMLHNSPASERANLELADAAEEAGLEIRRLTSDEAYAVEPGIRTDISGAVLFQQDSLFDPERLMRSLYSWLDTHGVQFFPETEVTGFHTSGRAVIAAVTESGSAGSETVAADHFVLAAGAWTGTLAGQLGVRILIQPGTGYSITINQTMDDHEAALRIPLIITDQKITVTPMPGRLRFGGTMTLVGFDTKVDVRRVRPMRRLIQNYRPEIGESELSRVRSGFRPVTSDGLPALGHSTRWNNVIFSAGHGMLGMTEGPATGQIVADLVAGRRPVIDIGLLDPDRF